MKISLCITTYNRYQLTIDSFFQVLSDERIDEIVVVDDCSNDGSFEKLLEYFYDPYKVKLYRNDINLGVYRNKKRSVELATNEWCIVFDSDNIIEPGYVDKLYELQPWDAHTEYCPALAEPAFDYTSLSDILISKGNVNTLWKKKQFDAFLNTMNSFWNREEYLKVWDETVEPISSDSIYMNYRWLAAGNKIQVVEGMKYQHLIHKGSHYVNNCAQSTVIHKDIEQLIKRLR